MNNDILAIINPDIHGRDFWKIAANEYDGTIPFVFLGDYLDPYKNEGISDEDSRNNFNEIWDFKEKWGDNVIMLLGNHDLSYYDNYFSCCRYSNSNAIWYRDFLRSNWEHFKFCHTITNGDKSYIFSHAGIHPRWLVYNGFEEIYDSDYINSLFNANKKAFNDYSYYRGGYSDVGSPIWADIREYANSNIKFADENIMQIVGHTQLIKDKLELEKICCIDSRQTFTLTKDGRIEKYKEG